MFRHSVVQVYFPEREQGYPYYNDQFELVPGDFVFVEGAMEGIRGRVEDVSYNFKINLEHYKRVIGKSEAYVRGEFRRVGSRMVTVSREAAPFDKIITYFRPPCSEDTQWIRGSDGTMHDLNDLAALKIPEQVQKRGTDYFSEDKVVYLSVDQGEGRAIVKGRQPYVVEFTYDNGAIGNMNCECFCTGVCKHQFAVIQQLKEMPEFRENAYFATMTKELFTSILLDDSAGNVCIQ